MSKPTITNMKVHNNNLVISYTNCSVPPHFVATDEEIKETDNSYSTGYRLDLKPTTVTKNIFKMNNTPITEYADPNRIKELLIDPNENELNSAFDTYLNWGCKDCNRLNTSVLGPIKDQGQCDSCWDFGTICVIESYITMNQIKNKKNKNYVLLSEQFILNKSMEYTKYKLHGCKGGIYQYAVQLIKQTGNIRNSECIYEHVSSSSCPSTNNFIIQPNNDINGFLINIRSGISNIMIKNLLQIYGPLVTAVNAKNLQHITSSSKNKIIPTNSMSFAENGAANHQVVLVGYGQYDNVNYWIIRNTWGETWGKDGCCAIEMAEDASDILLEIGAILNLSYAESLVDSNTVNQPLS
jgi:hypothetical protein